MKAVWKGKVIAEAGRDELIYIEGNWYFPPNKVRSEYLSKSDTPYTCPWKGECQYFNINTDGEISKDDAWCYPHPKESAIEIVKKSSGKDFSGYIAFWRSVAVEQ
jgi:uncharacterized protein (DUF427 family)